MASGGARPGAGRPKGSKHRATVSQKATLSELAKALAPDALNTLGEVMRDKGQSGAARVAAANSILDRAYGRVPQAQDAPDDADAKSLNIKITTAQPIGEVRVTRSDT